VDGIHYHFWTPERFQKAVASGEMLEHAIVHGRDFYGTPRSEVDPHLATGTGVLLVIDVQGAEQVRRQEPVGQFSVFLTVTDFDNLRHRLEARGESPAAIERRLQTATREVERASEFDHRVLNDDLTAAVADLEAVIRDRFPLTEK